MNALYFVLKTDYDNYAIIVSCNSATGTVNDKNVWVLSRKTSLAQQFDAEILRTLSSNNVSSSALETTMQNCDSLSNF